MNLKESFVIGDREIDIEMGKNAGCTSILVSGKPDKIKPDYAAKDLADAIATNESAVFQYNLLQSIVISPQGINFNVVTGATNQTATNDPTIINNTGNYDFWSGINITGQNLTGVTNSGYSIAAANISVNISANANGDKMQRNAPVRLSNANLTHGPPGASNISLYFYIDVPTGLSAQVYNVTAPWEITLE